MTSLNSGTPNWGNYSSHSWNRTDPDVILPPESCIPQNNLTSICWTLSLSSCSILLFTWVSCVPCTSHIAGTLMILKQWWCFSHPPSDCPQGLAHIRCSVNTSWSLAISFEALGRFLRNCSERTDLRWHITPPTGTVTQRSLVLIFPRVEQEKEGEYKRKLRRKSSEWKRTILNIAFDFQISKNNV